MAVLFLTFSIGSGVNKSLEACNRTMGKPMAQDLKQLYGRFNTEFTVRLKETIDIGRQKTQHVYNSEFSAVLGKFDRLKTVFYFEIKNQVQIWQNRLINIYRKFINKTQDQKNLVLVS